MDRWFTSDPHLGDHKVAEKRGFSSAEEHDEAVIDSINAKLPRRSKLWILGDIVANKAALPKLDDIQAKVKVAFLGNHDAFTAREYLQYFHDVKGVAKYSDLWLSHIPVHPQELYRVRGNVHGHIHKDAATAPLPYPYFNVNWDFHRGPVSFEEIDAFFPKREPRHT